MRIACLHTAHSNIAVFDAAATQIGLPLLTLNHLVRADLLAAAEQAGGLTPEIATLTTQALLGLCQGSDAVLLTCSTLGPAVDALAGLTGVPVLRVDQALATQAVAKGGHVVALCAVETTLAPTSALFRAAANHTGASVEVRLVAHAWPLFKAGNLDGYLATIAAAADQAWLDGAEVVALAQASMMPSATMVQRGQPLTSPVCGLQAAVSVLQSRHPVRVP